MSVRVSLRGIFRLIRVDTLSRVHNVGFLVERLIYTGCRKYGPFTLLNEPVITGKYDKFEFDNVCKNK